MMMHDRTKSTHLALLRGPLSIRVPVIHNLVTSRIPKLGRGMAERSVGRPLDFVARRLGDEERFRASHILVVVDAFLDFVIHDRARRDLGGYAKRSASRSHC